MCVEFREQPCKVALSRVQGMHFDYSLNPYMGCAHRCTFCYVRAFEQRAARPSGEAYGRSIRVKTNVVGVLGRELRSKRRRDIHVAIGSATDPYQPAEGKYRLTRGCIEALAEQRVRFSIITRGPLALRDIDVLRDASSRCHVAVSFSIPTLDEDVWRRTEPGTAPPRQRLRALRALADAGIDAGISIAPVLPGLSDGPAPLEAVMRAARDAGARHLWCGVLRLSPGTREHFLDCLARDWPELTARYEGMYRRVSAPGAVTGSIESLVEALRQRYGIGESGPHGLPLHKAPQQLALFGRLSYAEGGTGM